VLSHGVDFKFGVAFLHAANRAASVKSFLSRLDKDQPCYSAQSESVDLRGGKRLTVLPETTSYLNVYSN